MSRGRLPATYYRPSTFFYDEARKAMPNTEPGLTLFESGQRAETFHYKTLKAPDIDPACQNALYRFIHPQFSQALTKSKVEGRYIPIPIDVAERHMIYFDEFEETTTPYRINTMIRKNRYKNVFPNSEYRIKLRCPAPTPQDSCPEYINASAIVPLATIPGLKQTYIAAQAPLPSTINAMWQMIWEQHVEIVVMLTRFCEGDVCKAIPYWPCRRVDNANPFNSPPPNSLARSRSRTSSMCFPVEIEDLHGEVGAVETYGNVRVEVMSSEAVHEQVIKRTFKLTYLAAEAEMEALAAQTSGEERAAWEKCQFATPRKVTLLHYTGWPDHGVPHELDTPSELFKVYRAEREQMVCPVSPVLVHCSAGIGRTGTFIAVDQMLDHIRHTQQVNAEHILQEMRRLTHDVKEGIADARNIDRSKYHIGVNVVENNKLAHPRRHLDEAGSPLVLRGLDARVIAMIVLGMRACRPGMVQLKEQYGLIYMLVQHCLSHPHRKMLGLM